MLHIHVAYYMLHSTWFADKQCLSFITYITYTDGKLFSYAEVVADVTNLLLQIRRHIYSG